MKAALRIVCLIQIVFSIVVLSALVNQFVFMNMDCELCCEFQLFASSWFNWIEVFYELINAIIVAFFIFGSEELTCCFKKAV